MSKLRIAYRNLVLDSAESSLSASAAQAGYAVTNLRNGKRGLPYRSTVGTGTREILAGTVAADWTVTCIALVDPVMLGPTGAAEAYYDTGSGLVLIGEFPPVGRNGVTALYLAQANVEIIQIKFTNPGAVSAYAELGALIITSSGYFASTINVVDGHGVDAIDPSKPAVSLGGQELYDVRSQFDALTLKYKDIADDQRTDLFAVWDEVGAHTPVMLAVDPDDMDQHYYGRLAGLRLTHSTRDLWDADLTFRESL